MINTLSNFGKRIPKIVADNSPVILTAIGVTGALTTAYLTGKASIKATQLIHEIESYELRVVDNREKIKLCWKFYIPAISSAVVTVAAIIGANRIGTRRAAALAAAFSLSERAFEEYKAKVIERVGAKKEEGFRDEIAQERVNKTYDENREVIVTGNGSVLCMDAYSGRYFLSDMETIRTAENDINHRVIHDSYASLSDFYELVGLAGTSMSDEVGWNLDKLLTIKFSATITEGAKKPCIVIDYTTAPVRHFNRLQ